MMAVPMAPAGDGVGEIYDSAFFQRLEEGTRQSARVAVPLIMELVGPASVVDVGCGTGSWVAEFRAHGVPEVLGLDGAWVPRSQLQIPDHLFVPTDLERNIVLERTFDIAICLEVAEHLPPESAARLVANVVRLAPVVVFSAAVPGQGGEHHVNEQWPSYWAALFASHGYSGFNDLRLRLWDRPEVEVWYRQNTLCYLSEASQREHPQIGHRTDGGAMPIDLVHPEMFGRLARDRELKERYLQKLEIELQEKNDEISRFRNSFLGRSYRAMRSSSALLGRKTIRS
jgi:SAM-dependent methyltransferase